jgi:hypothetical protein
MRKLLTSICAAAALNVPVAALPAANASTATSKPATVQAAAQALRGGAGFFSSRWRPQPPCPAIRSTHSVTLILHTGGDDLRSDSEVVPYLRTTKGNFEMSHFYGEFPNYSSRTRTLDLLTSHPSITSCNVTGLSLTLISHPSWSETADNWNLDGVEMRVHCVSGRDCYVLNKWPYHRLTADDSSDTEP